MGHYPDLGQLLSRYEAEPSFREYVQHNHTLWRWVTGGADLMKRSPLSFDPVEEYWYCPERRVLVSFFAQHFAASYAPAEAMRQLAWKVFRHFDEARDADRFGGTIPASQQGGVWSELVDMMVGVAKDLPAPAEYTALRTTWSRYFTEPQFRTLLLQYLEVDARAVRSASGLETSFYTRIPWFPYLGLRDRRDLVAHQRFFCGLYFALGSTNSYLQGGSMSMAPILQNNRTDVLADYVDKWAAGATPYDTKFVVAGKDEKKDRSHISTVEELWGLLNLHHSPFHNQRTEDFYRSFEQPSDKSIFDQLRRVGHETRQWLAAHPDHAEALAGAFRVLARNPTELPDTNMEGIRPASVLKRHPKEAKEQVDLILIHEMHDAALSRASGFSVEEAATAMLHLLLDASLYTPDTKKPDPTPPASNGPRNKSMRLPNDLHRVAQDAFGYLKAGYHVLFAGPPGTGKTTVAQFVGHAWNHSLTRIETEIDAVDAPATTVGNSAWSPFHTIGGILPGENGKWTMQRGIFIEPDSRHASEWQLRADCLVLDEMNRADLDRCIGELYPLLSHSVSHVRPAGIPGVASIRSSDRFRLVATVNDATLDDIVFPISEGLARRFIRIELPGARLASLKEYLGSGRPDRVVAATQVIEELFQVCRAQKRLTSTELGEHLPFGVGYFATLRDWCTGDLQLSAEFGDLDVAQQAYNVVLTGLRSALKSRDLEALIAKFREDEAEA